MTTALTEELVASGGVADLRKSLASSNQLMLNMNRLARSSARLRQSRIVSSRMTQASLRRATSGIDSAKIDSTLSNVRDDDARTWLC